MHNHLFSDAVFARLQKYATPLVDSIDDVISRALDALENQKVSGGLPSNISAEAESSKDYVPDGAPSLTNSTPNKLVVDGIDIQKPIYWSTLLAEVIKTAAIKGMTPSAIAECVRSPTKAGLFEGPGYRFVAEAGLSFQQLNSDRTWAEAYRLARKAGIPISVRWAWNHHADTANSLGMMTYKP